MNINFTPWTILWALLSLVVLVMAGYRKVVSGKEDETLHLGNPSANAQQATVAHKLEVIDKWGKLLTIVAAAFGLLLAIAYTYQTWVQSSSAGQ
jgi:hypothetical protein